MNLEIFEKIGLTKGERKVYESLIGEGQVTTGKIIKKSKISGSKVYEILNKLIDKGFVSYVTKENIKYFEISNTNKIIEYIEKKEEEIKHTKEDIKKVLPLIESSTKNLEFEQKTMLYEGIIGIKNFYDYLLENTNSIKEYYAFSFGEELENDSIKLILTKFHQKREEKKIFVKIISNAKYKNKMNTFEKYDLSQIKYKKQLNPKGLYIFNNHIAIIDFSKNPTTIIIKSKNIYESYKEYFLDQWEN